MIDRTGQVRFAVAQFSLDGFREGRVPILGSADQAAWYLDTSGGRIEIAGHPKGSQPFATHPFFGGLARVEVATAGNAGNLTGWVGPDGRVVILPSFPLGRDFSEGLAAAKDPAGGWGYLDTTGSWAIAPRFKKAFDFHDGFARVSEGYVDHTGRLVGKTTAKPTDVMEQQWAGSQRLPHSEGDWREG